MTNLSTGPVGQFLSVGISAQRAVDRAIARADLVRNVRDAGTRVRELTAAGHSVALDNAITEHQLACNALDCFDHQPKGRAP